MSQTVLRVLWTLAAALSGAAAGRALGGGSQWPFGAVAAVALSLGWFMAVDRMRAGAVLRWLGGALENDAPRFAGAWGEAGYRAEKVVRGLQRSTADEQQRLAQFLSAVEASPNGVLLIDANEQIEWFNRIAAQHFNLDAERDRRQRVTNLIRAPVFVAYLQSGRYDEAVSVPASSTNGIISVLIRPYGDRMRLVLSQDITEREQADLMRRDFVANVSHEIRSPLTVLAGFVETLGNVPLTETERGRVLAHMGQQTHRMQTLVKDLLALAQLEGSPRPSASSWVSVEELLRHVESDARAVSAGSHQLTIMLGADAQVCGTESELFSAVWNLVANALRYTPPGGSVTVAWVLRSGGGEFRVTDTGIGIAREHLPRLTERFYRVDPSRSRETGGTGLGLAIVKHVVQRHGGELAVDSELDKGSTFRIVLPASRVRPVTSPSLEVSEPAK